ncbi:hypothetical protein [Conexibacter woesei]|uniref:hypothetical protein n=1 Tax=Conexibacter woesei TaxID=191495 RepID=UPI0012DCE128|nr:hypothetical protein [Conexibacter woesei]
MLLGTLLSALVLSSTASAGVSKYCKLLPGQAIARPVEAANVKTSSIAISNPSLTKAKGRLTLCTHKVGGEVVAQTSVASFGNATAAKGEFAALIHRQQRAHARLIKTSGPWNDAYYMGEDGFLVQKGRYTFHIQYASGAPGYSKITSRTLAGLAGRAVAKL